MPNRPVAFSAIVLATLAVTTPANAQQTVNLTIGYFSPLSEQARATDDVLRRNIDFLAFEMDDFKGPTFGGEWLAAFGGRLEAGVGVAYATRTVPSVYANFVDTDGTEIDQDLRLRLVPVTFSVRLLPFGTRSGFQPYIGAGLGLIRWQYEESGEFVDFRNRRAIFTDTYRASGTAPGAVVLGGLRFAGDTAAVGVEVRRQSARADLDSRFSGDTLDLGGWALNVTLGVRF